MPQQGAPAWAEEDLDALTAAVERAGRIIAGRARDAADAAQDAHHQASAGWQGPAGEAFASAARDARLRIDRLAPLAAQITAPVARYVDTMRGLRRRLAELTDQWNRYRAAPVVNPQEADEIAAVYRQLDLVAEQAGAEAARDLQALVDQLQTSPLDPQQTALTIVSKQSSGIASYVTHQAERIVGPGALSTGWKVGGTALAPLTSGLSQALDDAEDPNFSTAERIGRAAGKALFNGVPDALAATAGGSAGLAAGALVGGPVGAAVGLVAGGLGAGAGMDAIMNSLPIQDDVVDTVGEAVDDAAHATGLEP